MHSEVRRAIIFRCRRHDNVKLVVCQVLLQHACLGLPSDLSLSPLRLIHNHIIIRSHWQHQLHRQRLYEREKSFVESCGIAWPISKIAMEPCQEEHCPISLTMINVPLYFRHLHVLIILFCFNFNQRTTSLQTFTRDCSEPLA